MTSATRVLVACLVLSGTMVHAAPVPDPPVEWARLTKEAADMGLPSRFLRLLPMEFVKLEFADLKNVAAEYHPEGHRMVFHLNLSEGGQGKRFRPLREVGNQELATVYHELFHAYFDYIDFASGTSRMTPQGTRLQAEAKRLAACRYTVAEVSVIPPQKASIRTAKFEKRRLTDKEASDAVNETWGVFVGWAVWNKLEATDRLNPAARWDWDAWEEFLDRLEAARANGELTGYFEPSNPDERKAIPRWYLAPAYAIRPAEIELLLEVILDEPPGMARLAASWVKPVSGAPSGLAC